MQDARRFYFCALGIALVCALQLTTRAPLALAATSDKTPNHQAIAPPPQAVENTLAPGGKSPLFGATAVANPATHTKGAPANKVVLMEPNHEQGRLFDPGLLPAQQLLLERGIRFDRDPRDPTVTQVEMAAVHDLAVRPIVAADEFRTAIDKLASPAAWLFEYEGAAYLAARQWRDAADASQQATAHDPNDEYAYFNMGVAYQHLGNPLRAIDAYGRAIEAAQRRSDLFPLAYFNRGVVEARLSDLDIGAISAFESVKVEYARGQAATGGSMGGSFAFMQYVQSSVVVFQPAEAATDETLCAQPDKGCLGRALADFQTAANGHAYVDPDIQMALGLTNFKLGYYAEATRELGSVMRAESQAKSFLECLLGIAYGNMDRAKDSVRYLVLARADGAPAETVDVALADEYEVSGDSKNADKTIGEAAALASSNGDPEFHRVRALIEQAEQNRAAAQQDACQAKKWYEDHAQQLPVLLVPIAVGCPQP